MVYYNEFDPKAAAWLRQLIRNGDIAPGVVDERSIIDVQAVELEGFTQHHFFAGVGVWSYALRNAGWTDDMPVCTASLPCQPFSAAGNQKGKEDERHLLPHFLELVKECGFNTIFGEQVESAIRHGWLDDLQAVMERESYAVGHCVLGAHSINAPHQRQRLLWFADRGLPDTENRHGWREPQQPPSVSGQAQDELGGDGSNCGVANSGSERLQGHGKPREYGNETPEGRTESLRHSGAGGLDSGMGNSRGNGHPSDTVGRSPSESKEESRMREPERPSAGGGGGLGDTKHNGHLAREVRPSNVPPSEKRGEEGAHVPGESAGASRRKNPEMLLGRTSRCGNGDNPIEWIFCRDNKYRPIKSGLKPLVDGLARGVVYSGGAIDPNNTGLARAIRLKGYGNAINARVACEFIRAFMDVKNEP